ncbi:MAG: hypothetical protein J6W89_06555 [Paludibacteraceae bacterium]|nr:hypothetical protein [Paludibacteraceae bacterium]
MHIPTLLIYGENRARAMGEMAEDSGLFHVAGQFFELAELLKATHAAYNDFMHDNINND